MEKKTIGKFISALRKANGITQKELGEKLFVSDKTVSRWECDECTPELSLIPSIAEIFGITTDELLRGERNNPDRETTSEETSSKHKAKSDKQFKLMLYSRKKKFTNLSFISIGLTVVGLITAMICNLGFSKGLLGFCLASIFFVAATICQICFTVSFRLLIDEEETEYVEKIKNANSDMVRNSVKIFFIILMTLAFCLPIITLINGANYGLAFDGWVVYGLLYMSIAFVVCYIIYTFRIRKILCNCSLLVLNEKQREQLEQNKKLLKKTLFAATAIALILVVCAVVWSFVDWKRFLEINVFEDCNDFKAFVENDYDNWYRDIYGTPLVNGEPLTIPPSHPEFPGDTFGHQKIYGGIQNSSGEDICIYCYNPDLYWLIEFTPSSEDQMPVTVISERAVSNARSIYQTVESILYVLIVIDFVVAAGIYLIKVCNSKKKGSV